MSLNGIKKGGIIGVIILFIAAGSTSGFGENHVQQQITNQLESDYTSLSEIILDTDFEEEWILDADGDYLAPPGWDVDGVCTSHQQGVINDCYTHYWNILYSDESKIGDDLSYLVNSGDSSACVWWSDGDGELEEIGQNQDEWLITPNLDFSNFYQIDLAFWSVYHFGPEFSNHSNFIKVSIDQGESWEIVTDLVHDDEWKIGGNQDGWEDWNHYEYPIIIDLSFLAGEPNVCIAWHHIYPSPGMDVGGHAIWAIDGVSITGIRDNIDPEISIQKPNTKTIYVNNEELIKWPFLTVIIGTIDITIDVEDAQSGIDFGEIFINNEQRVILDTEPYMWTWDDVGFGIYQIQANVFDKTGNQASSDVINVLKLF